MITWKHASDAAIDLYNLFELEKISLYQTSHIAKVSINTETVELCRANDGWIMCDPKPEIAEKLIRSYHKNPNLFSFQL
jgi:hypothetical protein